MSEMKGMCNIAAKNEHFGEACCSSLSQEMRDNALLLLMYMIIKRNCDMKSKVCAHETDQRPCTNKKE